MAYSVKKKNHDLHTPLYDHRLCKEKQREVTVTGKRSFDMKFTWDVIDEKMGLNSFMLTTSEPGYCNISSFM